MKEKQEKKTIRRQILLIDNTLNGFNAKLSFNLITAWQFNQMRSAEIRWNGRIDGQSENNSNDFQPNKFQSTRFPCRTFGCADLCTTNDYSICAKFIADENYDSFEMFGKWHQLHFTNHPNSRNAETFQRYANGFMWSLRHCHSHKSTKTKRIICAPTNGKVLQRFNMICERWRCQGMPWRMVPLEIAHEWKHAKLCGSGGRITLIQPNPLNVLGDSRLGPVHFVCKIFIESKKCVCVYAINCWLKVSTIQFVYVNTVAATACCIHRY